MTDASTLLVQSRFAFLEKKLDGGDAGLEDIQQYCELAAGIGQNQQAHKKLAQLKDKHPHNVNVSSMYIASCLQQGDDTAAMAAIESMTAMVKPEAEFMGAALSVRRRLGPMTVRQDDPYSISLCIIARNESKFLGPCLKSIKPLVDEIILVDTGSDDRTADIGRVFGAVVHEFEWCNNFSDARNFGLSKASGRWVLILDADEAIAATDFDLIRTLIRRRDGGSSAFAFETRNYSQMANTLGLQSNEGKYPAYETGIGWFPSTKVRLFKRSGAIRFHFPVHERVEPSLRLASIPVSACSAAVHHYGCLDEARNIEKAKKYYALGIAKLEEMADDPAAIRELAVQAGQLEHWKEAVILWQRFLEKRPGYTEALINMASAHWQLGHYDQSLKWAQKAIAADKTMKEAHFNKALSHMMIGDFTPAQVVLEEILKNHPAYKAGGFMLSVVYACTGQGTKALEMFSRLHNGLTGDVLAQAVEDIRQRLQKAALADAAAQLAHTFMEIGLLAIPRQQQDWPK